MFFFHFYEMKNEIEKKHPWFNLDMNTFVHTYTSKQASIWYFKGGVAHLRKIRGGPTAYSFSFPLKVCDDH